MTLNATASHGAQIKMSNMASSAAFTAIEGIFGGPNGPSWDPSMIEQKHHSSESPVRKVSTISKGAVTFSILYDSTNTQHLALMTAAAAGTKINFQQILTDAGAEQYAYGAYIGMAYKGEVEGFNQYDVTLNIDGDIATT